MAKAAADLRKRKAMESKKTKDEKSEDESESDRESEPEIVDSDDDDDDDMSDAGDGRLRDVDDDDEMDQDDKPRTPLDFKSFASVFLTRSQIEKVRVLYVLSQSCLLVAMCPAVGQILERGHFELQLVHEECLEPATAGMFVRLSIGQHEESQTAVYRACEIVGVKDGMKRYSLGKTKTVRKLILKFGRSERSFFMDVISTKPVMKDEYSKWETQMKKDDLEIFSKESAEDRLKSYTAVVNAPMTNAMIHARQKRLRQVEAPSAPHPTARTPAATLYHNPR